MGMEIKVKVDQAFLTELEAIAGEDRPYSSIEEYVGALIDADMHRRRDEAETILAGLREAFATPIEECVLVSAEDVIASGRARRRA